MQDKIEKEFLKAETRIFSENWHLSLWPCVLNLPPKNVGTAL